MQTIKLSIYLICCVALYYPAKASDVYKSQKVAKDTIEILFGNNSKIIVVAASKEDLEKIQKYDVNAMLADLNLKIEKSEGEKDVLVIEDKGGKKYLKDTTLVYEDREFEELEDDFEENGEVDDEKEEKSDDWWSGMSHSNKNKTSGEKRTWHEPMLDIGMNNYLENGRFPDGNGEPYTVKPFGSWYVALGSAFRTRVAGPLALEWGGNISWYNFKFVDPAQRIVSGDESVLWELSDLPSPIRSKLTVTYVNVSAVPMLDFGYKKKTKTNDDGTTKEYYTHKNKNFRVGMGGYLGYKIDSYSKFVYEEDGKNKDHSKNSYYLENLRYGLQFKVGYDGVDLFVNYDLNTLFHAGRGPELNAFSFGISF